MYSIYMQCLYALYLHGVGDFTGIVYNGKHGVVMTELRCVVVWMVLMLSFELLKQRIVICSRKTAAMQAYKSYAKWIEHCVYSQYMYTHIYLHSSSSSGRSPVGFFAIRSRHS